MPSLQLVYGALTRVSEKDIAYIAGTKTSVIARGVMQKYFDYYDDIPQKAKLHELFDEGETLSGFLIRFALSVSGITTLIIGSGSEEHIIANAGAAEKGPLKPDVLEEAKKRLGCTLLIYSP